MAVKSGREIGEARKFLSIERYRAKDTAKDASSEVTPKERRESEPAALLLDIVLVDVQSDEAAGLAAKATTTLLPSIRALSAKMVTDVEPDPARFVLTESSGK